MVEVYLYGKLRRFTRNTDPAKDSIRNIRVKRGDTINDITRRIGIPDSELGPNIFLDGIYSALTRKVKSGSRLALFPDDMALLYKQYFKKEK